MAIAVQCGCGRKISAPDALAGKSARCTYCGKAIPVPAPASPSDTIAVACSCGKRLKAPARMAGKTAKCPACGNSLTIEPILEVVPEAPPPAPEPEPEAPPEEPAAAPRGRPGGRARPRTRRFQRELGPMPGLATALGVLSLLESLGIGIFALLFILAGGLFAAASHGLAEGGKGFVDLMAESTIEDVKKNGGRITRDEVVLDENGRKMRQIAYVQTDGSKGSVGYPIVEEDAAKVKGVGTAFGGIIALIGVGLGVCALGKLLSGIGFLMKKNWGRVGLVALSGFESLVILLAVLGGGASALILIVLLLNLAVVVYFLTGSVKQACR